MTRADRSERRAHQLALRPRLLAIVEEHGGSTNQVLLDLGISYSSFSKVITGKGTCSADLLTTIDRAIRRHHGEHVEETKDERQQRIRDEHTARTYELWRQEREARGATMHEDITEMNLRERLET